MHIFSAEDHSDGPSNAADDFNTCMDLIRSKLRLTRPCPANGIEPDKILPGDATAEETEDLAPRTARLARLGRLLSQNGDLNRARSNNDALDKIPPGCCSYVVIRRS